MFSNQGKQARREWVYRALNKLCKEAGIDKKVGTHTMRRSRATHLLNREIPLEQVSKYLRHKNLSTTMEYLKITTADIQENSKNLAIRLRNFEIKNQGCEHEYYSAASEN